MNVRESAFLQWICRKVVFRTLHSEPIQPDRVDMIKLTAASLLCLRNDEFLTAVERRTVLRA